jgi:hypothetical protein
VEFERRGALLTSLVSDRGKLHLQALVEGLLRAPPGGHGMGFTEPSRALLDRTSLAGDVQLGDGKFAVAGVQGELGGQAEGRNAVRIHSDAVARGLTLELPSFLVRNVLLDTPGAQVHCDEVSGVLTIRLAVDNGQWRVTCELADVKLSGLQGRASGHEPSGAPHPSNG